MFIQLLDGPYKGEVRDVVFESAEHLVKSGRALKVNFDTCDGQSQLLASSAAPVAQTSAPQGKKAKARR